MELKTIGAVCSPYKSLADNIPRQGFFSEAESCIEIAEAFAPALEHIEEHEWLTVLYWAHLAERDKLMGSAQSSPRCS